MTDREFIGKMYFLLQREPRATVICDQLEDMLAERLKQPQQPQWHMAGFSTPTRPATREEKIVKPGVYEVPVEQEPVAWMWKDGTVTADPDRADGTWTPLYTAPQPREWVGLTEEEFSHGLQMSSNTSWMKAAKWVEAKLREKNA